MSDTPSFLQRHHFLLRRLHSLTGVVPIGFFLIVHLTTNSSVVWGALNSRAHADTPIGRAIATFQEEVSWINSMPLLLLTEIFVLWLPIAFHSVLGVYYASTGRGNLGSYPSRDNARYAWQRLSGYVGLVFVLYHVATLRWGWTFLVPGGTQWSHYFAASTLASALRGSPEGWTPGGVAVSVLYLAGVTMLVFHFANGLWTAAITWGLTISRQAQRRWGYVCAGLGVGLMGAGWSALFGFLFLVNTDDAAAIERSMVREKYGQEYLDELLERYGTDEAGARVIGEVAGVPFPGAAPDLEDLGDGG